MDKDIIVLTSEPAHGKTVGDVRLWVETHSGENNLAKAIIRLENQPDLCKKMSIAGREQAKSFDKNNYYEHFLNIIM